MNSSDQIESMTSDRNTLTEARNKVEELRLWVETELDRSALGSRADDALESLHLELENRRGTLNGVLNEIEDELGAVPDGTDEHRRNYYRNLGIGTAA